MRKKGDDKVSIKLSRYHRPTVIYFRCMGGEYDGKTKIWCFEVAKRHELRNYFSKDHESFTLI